MYKIVSSSKDFLHQAIREVETQVEELKENGWTEQGGVSISHAISVHNYSSNDSYYTVAQAMVKK